MAPGETENNAYANFGVTNKEHYGMLWYFLEWSIMVRYHGIFWSGQLSNQANNQSLIPSTDV